MYKENTFFTVQKTFFLNEVFVNTTINELSFHREF